MMTNVADRAPLIKALGIDLPDEILTIALTHRSYSFENGGLPTNERLEFLGDAVLGLVITAEIVGVYEDCVGRGAREAQIRGCEHAGTCADCTGPDR